MSSVAFIYSLELALRRNTPHNASNTPIKTDKSSRFIRCRLPHESVTLAFPLAVLLYIKVKCFTTLFQTVYLVGWAQFCSLYLTVLRRHKLLWVQEWVNEVHFYIIITDTLFTLVYYCMLYLLLLFSSGPWRAASEAILEEAAHWCVWTWSWYTAFPWLRRQKLLMLLLLVRLLHVGVEKVTVLEITQVGFW